MTRRPTLLAAALVAGLVLSAQAVGGWRSRPLLASVAAEVPVSPPPAATPPAGSAGLGAGATPGTGGAAPGAVRPPATPAKRPAAPARRPAGKPAVAKPATGKPATGPFAAGVRTTTRGDGITVTYDDGPHPEYTPQILALLRAQRVRAVFCVVGTQAAAHPELIQQIVREGHQLCNHSWDHEFALGTQTPTQIRANMRRTNDAIRRAAPGAAVPFFRHPGGMWTPRAIQAAAELRMAPVGWTVDPRDWDRPPATTIVSSVLRTARKRGIVLMHDGGGDRTNTVDASRTLLPALKKRLRVVPLS